MTLSYSFRERLAKRHIAKHIERLNGCGVLVLQGGKVLCGRRIEHGGRGQICGAGGHIERGETPEEAAYREAKEEFNIDCQELEFLGVQDGGNHYGKSAVFLCHKFYGEPKTDEVEMTDPMWVSPEELDGENLFPPFAQSLELLKIKKYNHNHGADGRFTTGNGITVSDSNRTMTTPMGVQVVKNPTDEEYSDMREAVLEQTPWLRGTGEPLFRKTFDEQGNVYYWDASSATHAQVEPYINEHYDTRTSQQHKWWEKDDKDDYPTDYSYMFQKYNHNHDPSTGRFTSGSSSSGRGSRGHVTYQNVDDYVTKEEKQKYGVSKALIMKDTGCDEKQAEDYQMAMRMWSITSVDIRAVQRGKTSDDGRLTIMTEKDAREYGETLEDFISKAPQWDGGTLYRGIEMEGIDGYPIHSYQFLQEGKIIDMGGTSSWSDNRDIAEEFTTRRFTGDAILFVSDNVGTATSIAPHSSIPTQGEVVASKTNKYRVDSVEEYENDWMNCRIVHVSAVTESEHSVNAEGNSQSTSKVDDFTHLMLDKVTKFNMFHGKDGKFTFSPNKGHSHGVVEGGHNRVKDSGRETEEEPRRMEGEALGRVGTGNKRGHLELGDGYHIKAEDGHILSPRELVARDLGCTEDEAAVQTTAITSFLSSSATCWDIRACQRGELEGFREKSLQPTADALDDYLERAPQWNGGAIYRGISEKEKSFYSNLAVGDVIDMGGASSWSSERSVANNYAGFYGEIFMVDNPTKGTSTRHLSDFPTENEVTVSSRVTYRVTDIEHTNYGTKITHLTQCRLPVTDGVSKSFSEIIEKYNHNHGADGRFTTGGGHSTRGHIETLEGMDFLGDDYDTWARDIIAHDIGCGEKHAERVLEAIQSFTGVRSDEIRVCEREAHVQPLYEEYLIQSRRLEEYVNNAPQWDGGTLYRGVNVGEVERHYDGLKVGDIVDMGGTASWSSEEGVAMGFCGGTLHGKAAIFVTDDPGIATSVSYFSQNAEEMEVLTSKDNRYKIDRIDTMGKNYDYIYVSAVK